MTPPRKLALLAVLALGLAAPQYGEPVNPDATREARKLLAFLVDIQGRYILTGQHNFDASGSEYTNIVQAITGKSPIVWGSDFSFAHTGAEPQKFQHCGPINLTNPGEPLYYIDVAPALARQKMVETAVREHKAGHIITLMRHAPPPGFGDTCDGAQIWAMGNRPTAKAWEELTTDGTPRSLACGGSRPT